MRGYWKRKIFAIHQEIEKEKREAYNLGYTHVMIDLVRGQVSNVNKIANSYSPPSCEEHVKNAYEDGRDKAYEDFWKMKDNIAAEAIQQSDARRREAQCAPTKPIVTRSSGSGAKVEIDDSGEITKVTVTNGGGMHYVKND